MVILELRGTRDLFPGVKINSWVGNCMVAHALCVGDSVGFERPVFLFTVGCELTRVSNQDYYLGGDLA